MQRLLFILLLTGFGIAFTWAQDQKSPDLEVAIVPMMTQIAAKKVVILSNSTPPSPIPVDGWHYKFTVVIKNISSHPIRVRTGDLTTTNSEQPSQTFFLSTGTNENFEGSAIIPPTDKLELVDLRPTESSFFNFEADMSVPLEKVAVTYAPQEDYQGRFGYWTGLITSKFVTVPKPHKG